MYRTLLNMTGIKRCLGLPKDKHNSNFWRVYTCQVENVLYLPCKKYCITGFNLNWSDMKICHLPLWDEEEI